MIEIVPNADGNGSGVKFSFIAAIMAAALIATIGFIFSQLMADKQNYFTRSEHQEFNLRMEGNFKRIDDHLAHVDQELLNLAQSKVGRDEISKVHAH